MQRVTDSETRLKELVQRREALERRSAERLRLYHELSNTHSSSLARQEAALIADAKVAAERNERWAAEMRLAVHTIHSPSSPFGSNATQSADRLNEAKRRFGLALDSLLPALHRAENERLEARVSMAEAERRQRISQRAALQHELNRRAAVEAALEAERREAIVGLADEQRVVMELAAAAELQRREGRALDHEVLTSLHCHGRDLEEAIAARTSAFTQGHLVTSPTGEVLGSRLPSWQVSQNMENMDQIRGRGSTDAALSLNPSVPAESVNSGLKEAKLSKQSTPQQSNEKVANDRHATPQLPNNSVHNQKDAHMQVGETGDSNSDSEFVLSSDKSSLSQSQLPVFLRRDVETPMQRQMQTPTPQMPTGTILTGNNGRLAVDEPSAVSFATTPLLRTGAALPSIPSPSFEHSSIVGNMQSNDLAGDSVVSADFSRVSPRNTNHSQYTPERTFRSSTSVTATPSRHYSETPLPYTNTNNMDNLSFQNTEPTEGPVSDASPPSPAVSDTSGSQHSHITGDSNQPSVDSILAGFDEVSMETSRKALVAVFTLINTIGQIPDRLRLYYRPSDRSTSHRGLQVLESFIARQSLPEQFASSADLGALVLGILSAKSVELLIDDIFRGPVTINRVRTELKRLASQSVAGIWDALLRHMSDIGTADQSSTDHVAISITDALLTHIPKGGEEYSRLHRKVLSLIKLAMFPESPSNSPHRRNGSPSLRSPPLRSILNPATEFEEPEIEEDESYELPRGTRDLDVSGGRPPGKFAPQEDSSDFSLSNTDRYR